jgi:hypothetical protein
MNDIILLDMIATQKERMENKREKHILLSVRNDTLKYGVKR